MANDEALKKLRLEESDSLGKLKQIVTDTLSEEKLIIDNLMHPPKDILSAGQKISDKVARFGGSWTFIISFMSILVAWIILNAVFLGSKTAFDPYPFILLNLILSCVAALQAPVIMMSQNRVEEKDRQRAENDYLINMKAEMEIRSLHQKMDLLLEEQIKTLYDTQAEQFAMLKEIKDKICELEVPEKHAKSDDTKKPGHTTGKTNKSE